MALTPTTWNPTDKDEETVTLSGGNLTAMSGAGSVRSIFGAVSGKHYWEVTFPPGSDGLTGVGTELVDISFGPGANEHGWAIHGRTGAVYSGWGQVAQASPWNSSWNVAGGTLSILLDLVSGTLGFWLDGVDAGLAIPVSGAPMYATYGEDGQATANFGATEFEYAPPADYFAGFGEQITPVDQVTQPVGASVLQTGVPFLQSGYEEILEPLGVPLLSVGAPTVIPYSNRQLAVPPTTVLSTGSPSILYDPISASGSAIFPLRVAVLKVGTPALTGSAPALAAGASVLAVGNPSIAARARAHGASLFAGGAPSLGVRVSPVSISVLRSGVPSAAGTLNIAGRSVLRVGRPRAVSATFVIAPVGANVFSAGLPGAPNMTVYPWSKTHCRTGAPVATRGLTC